MNAIVKQNGGNGHLDPAIIESPVWDIICRIAVAAEELSRCDEYIDAQGGCILRDARQLIGETVDANILRRMRASDAATQECAGLHVDVPKIPEVGAGVSGADTQRL